MIEITIQNFIQKKTKKRGKWGVQKGLEIAQWNALNNYWDKRMGEDGDWYYKNIIHPSIFKLINNFKSLKILDAGCSTGSLSRSLAKKGANVIGIDFSPKMIEKAKEREYKNPLKDC